jgi:hypothetical protein
MQFQLTRKQMTNLLYSLKGEGQEPSAILAGFEAYQSDNNQIPHFLLKRNKKWSNQENGLSTNEIVSLANLCELTSLTSSSLQNWIKRDVKDLIGAPELGKKYSIEQVAMLLIVKDLKTVFDFEKIRQLLTVVFNTLSDRSDDFMSPLAFFEIYATVLDSLDESSSLSLNDRQLENNIISKVHLYNRQFPDLSQEQWEPIKNVLVITVLAVLATHLQLRTQLYLNTNSHLIFP